jgi:membrane protein implicated in regulation of membrane protease activity
MPPCPWRVTAAVLFALLAACGSVLALNVIFGALTGASAALLVLGIWLAGSLAVLACVDLLHLAERRRAPERKAEIYAMPGTTHVRRRLAHRRAAALETAG